MKKAAREFDVVPVSVVLKKARLLEQDDSDIEALHTRGKPAADASPEAPRPRRRNHGEK
jgi:hypothetical protein